MSIDGAKRTMGVNQISEQRQLNSLASRIALLYETMSPAGEPASDAAVAEGIFEKTGVQMSGPYLCLLRTGKRTNPSIQNVQAIADYFGVPTSYLVDADSEACTEVEAELKLVRAMRDMGIRDIATRLSGLTQESIANLVGLIDRLRELEHLPPVASPQAEGEDHHAQTSSP